MSLGIVRRSLLRAAAMAAPLAAIPGAKSKEDSAGPDNFDDAPFAEHHLALQLSDRDQTKQSLVLSVANNMVTIYGPDMIALEVVAFGPGIDLVRGDSPNRIAVDSLIAQGVTFDVCMNTVEAIERETGKRPYINEKARPVQAGVARILRLVEKGYTLVRP
jgi:intracellular sulfur oxidation DsrE/DsrF family protein